MMSTAAAKSNTRIRASLGPRGLAKNEIVETAVSLMEEVGEAAFSVRKLGGRVGCDPMAILYHFKNKDGMYRAMADALAKKGKFDLVIMGSHGHGALGSLMLGSAASKVLAQCKVPVLIVR